MTNLSDHSPPISSHQLVADRVVVFLVYMVWSSQEEIANGVFIAQGSLFDDLFEELALKSSQLHFSSPVDT